MTNARTVRNPPQVTPAWLTATLRGGGFLTRGGVSAVEHGEAIKGGYSLLWPLRVRYSADTPEGAPAALLLKVPRPDIDAEQTASNGQRECFFYGSIAPTMADFPVVRCYGASYVEGAGEWHLLLEDLSTTHHESAGYLPPPVPLCTDAVEVLARLHAHWWGDPRLDELRRGIDELLDEERIERQTGNVRRAISAFLAFLGGHASEDRRATYERLAKAFPALLRRLLGGPVTLLHGDAHWRNFLYPRSRGDDAAGGTGFTRIFDWQSCTVGPPAHDLAYMLARHWHPEPRRDLMDRLLRAYYQTLLRGGVGAYSWDRFFGDFRMAALRHAVAPATNWFRWGRSGDHQQSPAEWARRLERFMVPFDALGCADLLATWA